MFGTGPKQARRESVSDAMASAAKAVAAAFTAPAENPKETSTKVNRTS